MNILDLIKAACKKAGVDEKHADRIQKLFKIEKEDADIDSFVSLFKDNVLPGITEAEAAAKEAAKKEAVSEYETTHKLKDGKPVTDPVKKDEIKIPETMDPALKALIEKQSADIATLTGLVAGVVKKSTSADKLQQVKEKLKGKVDEKFLDRVAGKVNLDAEDLEKEIEAQITDFNDFKQALINEQVGGSHQQQRGIDAEKLKVDDWVKMMDGDSESNPGTVDLGLK